MIERAQAAARRDVGMQRATDHADRVQWMWSDEALHALECFCLAHPDRNFLGEDVRDWSETMGLVAPPVDNRAWGSVFQKAARFEIIKKVGYACAKSSNLSPKVQWAAV